ncbi:trypsin-like serine protease [Verrucomicrobiales bacterium]|nr:trypsin-like serine protease [Verrucomicrobiales bacterium]
MVTAIEWGDTNLNPPNSNLLQGVDLTIRSIASARRDYGNSLMDRHLAASSPGRDTCQGDSGGPLFVAGGGTGGSDLVVGITSFGLDCAAQSPGIYANVGKYNSWIDAFLAAPGDVGPAITITGKSGRLLTNGTRQRAQYLGTHWRRRYKRNKGKTLSYRIQNAVDTTPALIRQVRVTGRGFKVKVKPPYVFGGTSQRLAIRFRAPNKTRTNKGVVRVYTSDPHNPVYSFGILAKSKRA